jgi:hypothetical protein
LDVALDFYKQTGIIRGFWKIHGAPTVLSLIRDITETGMQSMPGP